MAANPIAFITDLKRGLTVKRFTEYGQNYAPFADIAARVGKMVDTDLSVALGRLLDEPVSALDLSEYQKGALASIGVDTVRKALASEEVDFQRAMYIGPVRSRKIMNVVTAAVLEFLSG